MTSRRPRRALGPSTTPAADLATHAYSANNRLLAAELVQKRAAVAILTSTCNVLRRQLIDARTQPAVRDASTQTSPVRAHRSLVAVAEAPLPKDAGTFQRAEAPASAKPSRTTTSAISYAEPSLKTKLRRPPSP